MWAKVKGSGVCVWWGGVFVCTQDSIRVDHVQSHERRNHSSVAASLAVEKQNKCQFHCNLSSPTSRRCSVYLGNVAQINDNLAVCVCSQMATVLKKDTGACICVGELEESAITDK